MFKAVRNSESIFSLRKAACKRLSGAVFSGLDNNPLDAPSNLGLTVGPEIDYALVSDL